MCATSSSAPADSGEQYRNAIDTYRAIAKWVVSSFGAVAGALVIGVQISSLGALHGWHLIGACASVAAVFVAILIIISAAVSVLVPIRVSDRGFADAPEFDALRRDLEEDPTPLDGEANTAAELAAKYRDYVEHEDEVRKAYERAQRVNGVAQDAESNQALADAKQALDDAEGDAETLHELVMSVTWLGRLLRTQQVFRRAMRVIYAAIILAGAGAVAFAYISSPPTTTKPSPPSRVHVAVNEPKTCVDLYLALDKLAHDEPTIGSHWPTRSLGAQDRACGLRDVKELARFLAFLAHH